VHNFRGFREKGQTEEAIFAFLPGRLGDKKRKNAVKKVR
jgi:hypothetical protein